MSPEWSPAEIKYLILSLLPPETREHQTRGQVTRTSRSAHIARTRTPLFDVSFFPPFYTQESLFHQKLLDLQRPGQFHRKLPIQHFLICSKNLGRNLKTGN